MGERRAASRRRSRKFLCGPWSCGGCSAAAGACRCYSSSGGCGGGGGGGGFWPRPPTPRLPCLHGSVGSYRRLIHGFEDVLRRRLRGHLRTSRLSPSIKSGIIITTQKPSTQECDTLSVGCRAYRVSREVPFDA